MTSVLCSCKIQHQTVYAALEANEILSLDCLALGTLNLFPNVTHIGSILMVVACTACAITALTKLCIVPESIKAVLQYTHYIVMGNTKSCSFFKRFLPDVQAP